MKLIRKYHVIPYEGTLLDSAKRFLESILADPSLDDTTKCRFYQDVLYRIKNHPEMNIATEETVDIVRENLRIHQPSVENRVEEEGVPPPPPPPPPTDNEDEDVFKFGENYAENESGPLKHVKQHHRFDPYGKPPQPLIDQTPPPPPPKIQTATKRRHIGDYDDDEPERKKYATPRKRKTNPFKKLIKKKKKTFNFMKPNLKRKQQRVDKKQKQRRIAEIKTEIKTEEESSPPVKHKVKYGPSKVKKEIKHDPSKVKKEVKHEYDPSRVKHEYDLSKVKKEVKHEYDPYKVKKEVKHEYDPSRVKKEPKLEYDPSNVKKEVKYNPSKVKKEVKLEYDPSKVKNESNKYEPSTAYLKRKIPIDPADEPWHKSRLIEESVKKKKTKKIQKKSPSNKRKLSSTSPYENVTKRRSLHGSGPAPPAGSRIYCRLWKF
ncbi:unnamed protein product [Caenorhabditis nigoni]